jgi:hypothetical protein
MSEPMWDTLEAHARAGLQYDSSVSFATQAGYRLGVALTTHLWNPVTERAVQALQIPPMAMDGHFYYAPERGIDETLSDFDRLLGDLKRFEGVAALDWHEYTAAPISHTYRRWAEGYRAVLDVLASDNEVAVYTGQEAAALGRSRMSRIPFQQQSVPR